MTLNALAFKNLKGYPGRTIALALVAALMTVATFGGTMTIMGLRHGLHTVKARLGADIMVTPIEAADEFNAQTFLIEAEPSYFYMESSILDRVAGIEGVETASPQIFLASARASCCSGRFQIIAFDPATDFVIQPWIADSVGPVDLGSMGVIVGSNVTVFNTERFQLFGEELRVVGQFDSTGSTLDNAVYMDFDTAKTLLRSSFKKNLNQYREFDTGGVISSVMVKTSPGADVDEVAARIENSVAGVNAATSKTMVSSIASTIDSASRTIGLFIALVWVVGAAMILLIFTLMMNERRWEFASLRAIGAADRQILRIVGNEALLVNGVGAGAGILASGALLFGFATAIGQGLGVGLIIPPWYTTLIIAVASAIGAAAVAAASSWITIGRIRRADAAAILTEGE
ncbi:ABC transporter permease [Actinomyces mediterranea]|uniref:ABC transporter permease n=1 Tax=Actinomyces mediterranea TaxID=1871028 RepID=UPI000970340F|nr:FtsX-like permease family protein [Actinomyces mediterranea]